MNRKWTVALVLVTAAVAAYAGNVFATNPVGVTTTQLAKASFSNINVNAEATPASVWQTHLKTRGLSDVYVVDNKIAPGGTTGWHSHPGPSMILVVAGKVSNYVSAYPDCRAEIYSAGDGFIDPGGTDVHTLKNESAEPAETIAIQIVQRDAPRKTDMATPSNCQP